MEGKKITWKDGIAAIRHLFYFNLVASKKNFFKPEIPTKYLPSDSQFL